MTLSRRVLALCLAVAATACGDASAAPAATARCGEVETFPIQGGGHLIGDREPPVPYNSTPPTSGWHSSAAVTIGVSDDPLTEPQQVGILEVGGVVVTHGALDDASAAALRDQAARHPGRVATTPYAELAPGQVVLAGWGVVQRCDGVDPDAIDAFVEAYAADDPDAPGSR